VTRRVSPGRPASGRTERARARLRVPAPDSVGFESVT
jgi:hypothetical protein